MKDNYNISKLTINVIQETTNFTKNNLSNVSGTLQSTKTKFAGSYNGTFNFNIKLTKSN